MKPLIPVCLLFLLGPLQLGAQTLLSNGFSQLGSDGFLATAQQPLGGIGQFLAGHNVAGQAMAGQPYLANEAALLAQQSLTQPLISQATSVFGGRAAPWPSQLQLGQLPEAMPVASQPFVSGLMQPMSASPPLLQQIQQGEEQVQQAQQLLQQQALQQQALQQAMQQQQQLQQQQQQLPSEGFLAVRQGPEPVRQFAPEQHRRPVQAFLQESEQERTVSAAAATSSVRVHSPAPALPGEGPAAEDCPCAKQPAGLAPASASFRTAAAGGAPAPAASGGQCWVSKVTVRQEHAGEGQGGMIMADVAAVYGSDMLTQAQRDMVHLARIASTSFQCLDDRVTEPSMSTPGGDLGEFILALASYLQERDPTRSSGLPPQKVIDVMLEKYSETLPAGRPMVHCTDDRAVRHLEAELPVENLDLNAPPTHAKEAGLLEKLTEVENQGDSHIRLMLKKPEWYELKKELVPMVLKSFYSLLWRQNQDLSAGNKLHQVQKLKLQVLVGDSNPSAFLEVSGGKLCHGDVAPMLTPRSGQRSVLISHLDAVSERRQELASFFARIANVTPRKIDRQKLHQRMERHGWLALETTGSRIAVGLPLYTLSYT